MPRTRRAAIYSRISRDRTGQAAGTRRQEHDCRELVEAQGWRLVDVFTDDDRSAYAGNGRKSKPRPAFDRLMDAVEAGTVDVVVAWHPDRLTRTPRELEDLIDRLEASHTKVETVRAGRWDLSTRSSRTIARVVGAVARDESEAKAERLQAMHADRARRGLWSGGPRPFGYQLTAGGSLEIIDAEAKIITEAADRVLAGEWIGAIAADLNARAVPTARGGRWAAETLRRMLTSCTVVGRRGDRPAAWPAILDEATWHALHARVRDSRRARGTVARVSLLAGVARCGRCAEHVKLITQRRESGARVYVCPSPARGGCGGVQIVAEPLDEHVADRLLDELASPGFQAAMADDDTGRRDAALDELQAVEQRRAELAEMWAAGTTTTADWQAATRALDQQTEHLQAELAELAPPVERIDPNVARAAWPAMTLAEKRSLVAMFVDSVVVSPATRRGPGFDPDRVEIIWRSAP
jgi:DNA invertase Pin-like site-specific DNA recombinase